jgi:hypothetical protein
MASLKNTTINDTGHLTIPYGTTAQRPTVPTTGMIRFNTSLKCNEYYNGTDWIDLLTGNASGAYGFLSSDTFIVPYVGTYSIHAVGGGAGASASWHGNFYGSGGGSGYYSTTNLTLQPGEVLTISIGSAGAGSAWNGSGGPGGTTTVIRNGSTILSASGGNPGGNAIGGSGGSGGGPGAANSDFRAGQGGYHGSNGQNAAGTGGTGQLGVAYGNGTNLFIPPGGTGSYIGGVNTWAGILGFGRGAQAGSNQDAIAAGGGAGGGTWAQPARAGKSGLVVFFGPL